MLLLVDVEGFFTFLERNIAQEKEIMEVSNNDDNRTGVQSAEYVKHSIKVYQLLTENGKGGIS